MTSINDEILESVKFDNLRNEILHEFDKQAFPTAQFFKSTSKIDWTLALFLASSFDKDGRLETNQAVLDICLGALQSDETNEEDKTVAALILERFGNKPSIDLAIERGLINPTYREAIPAPLRMDSISAQLEFTIAPASGSTFVGSEFQNDFWEAASKNEWVSISAPTSTGKSYVVKRWVVDQLFAHPTATVLYVVPTRALVEEVSATFRNDPALESVPIFTVPWDTDLSISSRKLLVMTQERVQMTLQKSAGLTPTAAFFDEAQKVGDGKRGILLENVLLESLRRNSAIKAVFASPMTSNPEVLLTRSPGSLNGGTVTALTSNVKQNLYWINKKYRSPKTWIIQRASSKRMREVAEAEFAENIQRVNDKRSVLPHTLAHPDALNIIYVNGPSDAENCAKRLYELQGSEATVQNQRVLEVQDLIRKSVHQDYLLAKTITRGVAFHYGSMPQTVRENVERLYREGLIKFLVCTSTLLEGVNLPCTNMWIMKPKRGKDTPMDSFDFWNLAGRAGRWGSEFAGNIICVDTKNWNEAPPHERASNPISFASETLLEDFESVSSYLRSDGQSTDTDKNNDPEALSALAAQLFDSVSRGEDPRPLRILQPQEAQTLQELVSNKSALLTLPNELRRRNPGINPQFIERLHARLITEEPSSIMLHAPHASTAYERLVRAMLICEETLDAGFGSEGNIRRLAILLNQWMRGWNIPSIVAKRYDYLLERSKTLPKLPTIIREVLTEIDQIARYRAPKYLSCYMDVLHHAYPEILDNNELIDVEAMLEFGVYKETQISLMSLGFSRTATLQISKHMPNDSMQTGDVIRWLSEHSLESSDLPVIIAWEIEELIERAMRTRNWRSS